MKLLFKDNCRLKLHFSTFICHILLTAYLKFMMGAKGGFSHDNSLSVVLLTCNLMDIILRLLRMRPKVSKLLGDILGKNKQHSYIKRLNPLSTMLHKEIPLVSVLCSKCLKRKSKNNRRA